MPPPRALTDTNMSCNVWFPDSLGAPSGSPSEDAEAQLMILGDKETLGTDNESVPTRHQLSPR